MEIVSSCTEPITGLFVRQLNEPLTHSRVKRETEVFAGEETTGAHDPDPWHRCRVSHLSETRGAQLEGTQQVLRRDRLRTGGHRRRPYRTGRKEAKGPIPCCLAVAGKHARPLEAAVNAGHLRLRLQVHSSCPLPHPSQCQHKYSPFPSPFSVAQMLQARQD